MTLRTLILVLLVSCASRPVRASQAALEGLLPEHLTQVEKTFADWISSPSSLSRTDQLINFIMTTGEYEAVKVLRSPPDQIQVVAIPLKRVGEIRISGNKTISNSAFMDLIALKNNDRFDRQRILDIGEAIKETYGHLGYLNAVIEIQFSKQGGNRTDVTFLIQENLPCKIQSITVETENSYLKTKVSEKLKLFWGKHFTEEAISSIAKTTESYFKSEQYLKAHFLQLEVKYNALKTEAILFYKITEPYKYDVFFQGFDYLTELSLYRTLNLAAFPRESLDPATEMAERIKGRYLNEGFANAQVSANQRDDAKSFRRKINILIAEDRRVKISNIIVQGRISRAADYYAQFIRDNSSDLIASGLYHRDHLKTGYDNLETNLKNQGFLEAKVNYSRTEFSNDKSKVTIVVDLNEGPLTQIRKITFSGAKAFPQATLFNVLGIKPNSPLHLKELENRIKELKTFYYNQGYLEMRILNEDESLISYDERGTQASISFEIYEGPQIRVGRTVLDGNKKTKSYVIYNELEFSTGQILTQERIDESTARLNKLGLFSRVQISTLETGTDISNRTVLVSVVEANPGLFNFGIGVTGEGKSLTGRSFTGISYRNIRGTARAASARVDLRYNIQEVQYWENKVSLGYLEPYLLGTRTKGRINLTHSESASEYSTSLKTAKITASEGFNLLLENDITSHVKLTWTLWSLASLRTFQHPHNLAGFQSTRNQIGTIGPTLDVDYRDSIFLPTRGRYFRWDIDYSDPNLGSSRLIHFVRTNASHTEYTRVHSNRWIWANSLHGGYVQNLSKEENSGVPASYAFFLGGHSTIRGFNRTNDTERIPNGEAIAFETPTESVIKNNSHYYLLRSEIQFPLSGSLGWVLFYDAGAVLISGKDIKKPFRQGAGTGIRYNTPVGPIYFDVGFKLDPQPGEEKFQPYFGIGNF